MKAYFTELVEKKFGKLGRYIFYRCHACHGIVIRSDIKTNGCCKCNGKRFSPTNLTPFEEIRYIWKAIW